MSSCAILFTHELMITCKLNTQIITIRCVFRHWRGMQLKEEGDPGRGGLQGTRPRAGQLGGPASRGLTRFDSRFESVFEHLAH
eukprot:1180073-Prorocentrum_minimum.AAC.1